MNRLDVQLIGYGRMNAEVKCGRKRPSAWLWMGLAVALLLEMLMPRAANALACVQIVSKYEQRGDQISYVRSNAYEKIENPVASADPKNFKPLPNAILLRDACMNDDYVEYGRDSQTVFFRGQPVKGADPDKFEFIDRTYARDGAGVYVGTRKLTTRVADFRVIEKSGYATDGLRYFYKNKILEGTNFQFVPPRQNGYVRTNLRVYYFGDPLDADPDSFEVIDLDSKISKDKTRVFYGSTAIESADPSTFKELARPYWKDGGAVYWVNRAVSRADVKSFEVLAVPLARDRNFKYNQGVVVCKVVPEAIGAEKLCN